MEYCTGNPRKIMQKEKYCKQKKIFLKKSLDLVEMHPKAHHQYIIVMGKANTINDHETKGHIAAGQVTLEVALSANVNKGLITTNI